MARNPRTILAAVSLIIASLACSGGGNEQATVDALSQSISGTATAAALNELDSGSAVQTAEANATEQVAALQATADALLNLSAADREATAQAAAPLLAELPAYGADPSQGELAWVHPPITIQVTGYLQSDFENRYLGTVARDFVLSSDITWNTTTGLSGCGFVFRSDGNEEAANQYIAVASRGGNGRVIFQSMANGDPKNAVDMYAYGQDPSFDWRNDATNRLTVVARGDVYTFYTNGVRVGEVTAGDPPSQPYVPPPPTEPPEDAPPEVAQQYEEALAEHSQLVDQIRGEFAGRAQSNKGEIPYFERGFVAMIAASESGTTVCQFDNTWLWLFK
jgi:hypothetical protein